MFNEWVLSEGILPYAFVRSFGSAPNPLAPWFLKFCELAPIPPSAYANPRCHG